MADAHRGIVAWFSNGKGFGFIERPPGEGNDIFVHFSAVVMDGFKTLSQGDHVEFEVTQKDGRAIATNVRVVGKGEHHGSGSDSNKSQFAPAKR